MNKEIRERIEQEAKAHSDKYTTSEQYNEGMFDGYVDGAESEHPKAWNEAIDACIQKLWDGAKPDKLWTEYQKDLESLKLDPKQE